MISKKTLEHHNAKYPLQTGFFAAGGDTGTKVHAVYADTKRPICGCKIGIKKHFQWCAHGAVDRYIECLKCRAVLESKGWPDRLKRLLEAAYADDSNG